MRIPHFVLYINAIIIIGTIEPIVTSPPFAALNTAKNESTSESAIIIALFVSFLVLLLTLFIKIPLFTKF